MKIANHSIHSQLPRSLQIFYFKNINSYHSDHRIKLRKKLYHEIKKLHPSEDLESILNLTERPQSKSVGISLSHSPMGSAVALVNTPCLIGIDCEVISRLNERIIERVSQPKERQQVADIRWIFSAKEAAWKALNINHPKLLISQIETIDWNKQDNGWIEYKVSIDGEIIDGLGFLYEFSDTYLSFYYSPSTFI